jgi:hypothetical protein
MLNKMITHSPTATANTLRRDIILTIIAGQAFMFACQFSQGWLPMVLTYILATSALFHCINKHSAQRGSDRLMLSLNLLACSGLCAALLFSGKGAQVF